MGDGYHCSVKTKEQHKSGADGVFLKTVFSQVPYVLGEPMGGVDNSFAAPLSVYSCFLHLVPAQITTCAG